MSSLLTSFKSKGKVLCGRSYVSPSLVLLGSIFDRFFFVFISLDFEPYDMVDPSTKDLFKVNFNFFKTELKCCLVKYLI